MKRPSSIRIPLFTALFLMAALLLHAQQRPASTVAATNQIVIDNFSFTPMALRVKAGTEITWTNHDDIPHTVVASDLKFKSKALDTNDSFSMKFTEPGTYEYFCSLHPKMTGKITVE